MSSEACADEATVENATTGLISASAWSQNFYRYLMPLIRILAIATVLGSKSSRMVESSYGTKLYERTIPSSE